MRHAVLTYPIGAGCAGICRAPPTARGADLPQVVSCGPSAAAAAAAHCSVMHGGAG